MPTYEEQMMLWYVAMEIIYLGPHLSVTSNVLYKKCKTAATNICKYIMELTFETLHSVFHRRVL